MIYTPPSTMIPNLNRGGEVSIVLEKVIKMSSMEAFEPYTPKIHADNNEQVRKEI